jgi:hypothetical protein
MARVRTKGVNPHGWEEKSRQEKAGGQEKEEITSRSDFFVGQKAARAEIGACRFFPRRGWGSYATASAE